MLDGDPARRLSVEAVCRVRAPMAQ